MGGEGVPATDTCLVLQKAAVWWFVLPQAKPSTTSFQGKEWYNLATIRCALLLSTFPFYHTRSPFLLDLRFSFYTNPFKVSIYRISTRRYLPNRPSWRTMSRRRATRYVPSVYLKRVSVAGFLTQYHLRVTLGANRRCFATAQRLSAKPQ